MTINKDNPPLVSIGIPAFNRPYELKNLVESIINQSYQNIELIIADDNSNNSDCFKLYNSKLFKDPRIKLILNKSNHGVLKNADLVLKKAKGKYFCWISDDDWRSDVFIEKMVEDIEKLGHGYICFCDYKEVINDCQLSPSHRLKKSKFSFLRNRNRVIRLITFYLHDHADGKCNLFYSLMHLKELKRINLKNASSNWKDLSMDRNIVFQLLKRNKVHINKSLLATLKVKNHKFYKEDYSEIKGFKFNFSKIYYFIKNIYKETNFSYKNEKSFLRFCFLGLLPIKIFLNLLNRIFLKLRILYKSKYLNSLELKAINKIHIGESKKPKNKKDLKNITLIVLASSKVERNMMAMRYSMLGLNFEDNLFFSHYKPWNIGKRVNYIKINPLKNTKEFNEFIFLKLSKYIKTDFILLINQKNFITNHDYWSNKFSKYDLVIKKKTYWNYNFYPFKSVSPLLDFKNEMILVSKRFLLDINNYLNLNEEKHRSKYLNLLNINNLKIFVPKTKVDFSKLINVNKKILFENNKLKINESFFFRDY